jgi:hypothetical protein
MKAYEIWSEGYLCTGMDGIPEKATFHGIYYGKNFIEACNSWAKEKKERKKYFRIIDGIPVYWGCTMFDNEKDARKSFG